MDHARAVILAFLRGRLGDRPVAYLDANDFLAVSATREDGGWRFFVGAIQPPDEKHQGERGLVEEQKRSDPIFLMSLVFPDESNDFTVEELHPALERVGREQSPELSAGAAFLNFLADEANDTGFPKPSG